MANTITQPILLDYGIDSDYTDVAITDGKLSSNGGMFPKVTISTISYSTSPDRTLTTTHVLGGHIAYDGVGNSRVLVTPTGALLDAAFQFKYAGTVVDFIIENTGSSPEILTLSGGAGVTVNSGDPVVVHAGQRVTFRMRRTGVATWVIYNLRTDVPRVAAHVNYDNVIAAEDVSDTEATVAAAATIVVDIDLVNGAQSVVSNPAGMDVPRNVAVTIIDATPTITAGTVTVTGIDQHGDVVSEVFDCAAGEDVYSGDVIFAVVTAVVTADFTVLGGASDEQVSVASGGKLGLPMGAGRTLIDVYKSAVNGVDEAVGTVDTTYGSIEPTSAPDNSKDFDFWYRYG